jgi:anti-sigma factor RsiW
MEVMLTCRDIVGLMTEYLEGTMATDARLRFERHLAICPACRGFLAQMRATVRLSGEVPEESLSPELRRELVDAFRDWKPNG